MLDYYTFHSMKITWLEGGTTAVDGGAQFGPVPKPLWSKKYEADELNRIITPTDPMLIQYQGKNILIDTGVGHKLTEKQIRNFGVLHQPKLKESLDKLELTFDDIDIILMTHFHFDHAGGLTSFKDQEIVSTFPNAVIYTSEVEWDEVRHPNMRSKNSYFKENWQAIENQVVTFKDKLEVMDGIEMIWSKGHSKGISIIKLTQNDEVLYHLSDLMATQAHQNPLWVMGFDDYPLDSIKYKQAYLSDILENGHKVLFYHDKDYRMIAWDQEGKEVIFELKRHNV